MEMALAFNDVQFEIVNRNNEPWLTLSQIATALGYTKGVSQNDTPFNGLRKLYTRHADEFTDSMTALVKLPTEGGEQETRIFSLRGCHLLAMLARTPVVKSFRKWVLDVLDRMAQEEKQTQATDSPITPDQQCTLRSIVKGKVEAANPESKGRLMNLYGQIWSRFSNHFRLAKYSQLPQSKMSEAIDYLVRMELKQKKVAVTEKAPIQGQMALPSGVPSLAERGKESLEKLLRLRADIFNANMDLRSFMSYALHHGAELRLTDQQKNFSRSLEHSFDGFWMAINSNLIAIEEMFRAFTEAEKMIYG